MIKRVFVDSDVILDLALAREPFVGPSRKVLSQVENGLYLGFVSANAVASIYYVLRKAGGDAKARLFLSNLLKYLTILPVDHTNVTKAVASDFTDFEDAIQYFCALENQCEYILTRNHDDYSKAQLPVYSPVEFLNIMS